MKRLRAGWALGLALLVWGCHLDFTQSPLDCGERACPVLGEVSPQDTTSGDVAGVDTTGVDTAMPGDVNTTPCDNACGLDGVCCEPELGAEGCVSTRTDPRHCGGCDIACRPGQLCESGACVCPGKANDCDGFPENGCETSLESVLNCGACGVQCGPGEACVEGICVCGVDAGSGVPACANGLRCCGDACVSPDDASCECNGALCTGSETCCPALAGIDRCVSLSASVQHCGGCGVVCADNAICVEGRCSCSEPGAIYCNEQLGCARFDQPGSCGGDCDDAVNCNDTLLNIVGDARCDAGACAFEGCANGFSDCDGNADNGCEASLQSVDHCGACGQTCSPDGVELNGSVSACDDGACIYVCNSGFDDCEAAAPGCETDLSSADHCGACGVSCRNLPNSEPGGQCVDGVCQVTCQDGFVDCDGDPTNGCETPGAGPSACIVTSCKAILDGGQSTGDGFYTIEPDDGAGPVEVYCDMTTAGGGWTRVRHKIAGTTPCSNADWDLARRVSAPWGAGGDLMSKVFDSEAGSDTAAPLGVVRFEPGPFGRIEAMFAFPDTSASSWDHSQSSAFNLSLISGPSVANSVSWNFGVDSPSAFKGYYFLDTQIGVYGGSLCATLIHQSQFKNDNFAHELYVREP